MYSVQPKLLKHCTLTIRGVSIISYIILIQSEKHCTECLNTLEQQAPIQKQKNPERTQKEGRMNIESRKKEAEPRRNIDRIQHPNRRNICR